MEGTAVYVAIIGFFGTIVTVAGAVVIAWLTSRGEREQTAESALERALRERLLLKKEKIEELEQDRDEALAKVAELEARILAIEASTAPAGDD